MDRDELREALDRDELNYPRLAEQAGPESIDDLEALVAEDEPRIAPKAAYLAALIDAEGSDRVVDSRCPEPARRGPRIGCRSDSGPCRRTAPHRSLTGSSPIPTWESGRAR